MEEDYLQLSGLQHYIYCPKQWALIHIEQVWQDNARTAEGNLFHQNVDDPTNIEKRRNKLIRHSIRVSSSVLKISGTCDTVEYTLDEESGKPIACTPIEYKVGRNKIGLEDRIQLCSEALCLEEMYGFHIAKGYLYYGSERKRTEVDLDDNLRTMTIEASKNMHADFAKGFFPKIRYGPKCKHCSLLDLCMPPTEKTPDVSNYIEEAKGV